MSQRTIYVGIFAVLALWALLNLAGFSWVKLKWLGDDDIILAAADYAAKSQIGDVQYQDGSDLLTKNPGCCRVERYGDFVPDVTYRLFGRYVVVVDMKYRSGPFEGVECLNRVMKIDKDGDVLENYAMHEACLPKT